MRRRWPGLVPAAANSAVSSAVSVISAGNGQLNPALASRFNVTRTVDDATPTRRAISLSPTPAVLKRSTSRTWRLVVLSAGIRSPVQKPKERTLIGPAEAPFNRATSSRNAGRNHLGTPGEIKSEWWATSSRIRGRLPPESAVEAAFFAERPLVPIAGKPAINETRIDRLEPRVVDAEPGRNRRPKILDQDIGCLDYPVQHGQSIRLLQVERDGALTSVGAKE